MIARNEPCPCGSGAKYKRCHGAPVPPAGALVIDRRFPIQPSGRRWDGEPGRLAVWLAHGYGDVIQACRFVPHLADRADAFLVAPDDAFAPLLRASFPSLDVVTRHPVPRADWYWTTEDLYRLSVRYRGADAPYLRATPRRLGRGRHVGLCWWAAPLARRRDVDPAALAPLFDVAGATWHSLVPDRAFPDLRVVDHRGELTDWLATAELVAGLDAVVSVDTAVAHLAGALARPLLLLDSGDARWSLDPPLYPTLHRFSLTAVADVAEALR